MSPTMLAAKEIEGPHIDWAAISPLLSLVGGIVIVLMVGLLRGRFARTTIVPSLTLLCLAVTGGLAIWQWDERVSVIAGAMSIDNLTLLLCLMFVVAGIAAVLLSLRSVAPIESGHGEYYSLLLAAILGMVVLSGATNLVTVFVGFELLSIPLYVLCASEMRRATSLESGLKYLIIGSTGSAVLLYGLALLYGATGSTDLSGIATALSEGDDVLGDPLLMTGIALTLTGLAFKTSVAPFHQWTPDVYEGAPTPITGFMAVATKAAAFGVLLRLFDVALISAADDWAPALGVLAVITIVVGNVGAIGQRSLKRILAYSSVAQAGYLLAGVVVTTQLGARATIFYLAVYLLMNLAAFAVIAAREREAGRDDDISSLNGLGAERPWLAWPMTIAMLSLAGFPATAGFFGKIELIRAAVDNEYAYLGVAIVLGSAISLAYYLRIVAAVWMKPADAPALGARPAMAGGSQEADAEAGGALVPAPATALDPDHPYRAGDERSSQPETVFVAVTCAAATIVFGLYPSPLFDLARDAASVFSNLIA